MTDVLNGVIRSVETSHRVMVTKAGADASDSGLWPTGGKEHGGCDDLVHLVNGMVSTLEILHDQMVQESVERYAPAVKIRADYRLEKIVRAVEALAVRENEAENRRSIPGVEASVSSLRDPEALFKLAVHPLAKPAAEAEKDLMESLQLQDAAIGGGSILLERLVGLEGDWIGKPCIRVFDGVAVSAVVVERVCSEVTGDDYEWEGFTIEHADGDREDLYTEDVREALLLGRVAAVRLKQREDGYPLDTVLQLQAKIYRTRHEGESFATIAAAARCDTAELLQLNLTRFTHIAGQGLDDNTTECSPLDPGTCLLIPRNDAVLHLRVVGFLGWSAVGAADGSICWPQYLVRDMDELDETVTLRCCPPPKWLQSPEKEKEEEAEDAEEEAEEEDASPRDDDVFKRQNRQP